MLKGEPVWALGTMSGTSLDGVDAAALLTDGVAILAFGPAAYRAYEAAERGVIHAALGRWPGEEGVEAAAEVVETAHAELLSDLLEACPEAEVIGFHGQTLAHDPQGRAGPRRTHQAGDGAVLASVLRRAVVWDFRSADVELGGQGAPLAPYFHFACAKWAGLAAPVAFLNLGGVGNVTWVDPRCAGPEVPGAVLAFDTGPANAPIDDFMRAHFGAPHDTGGEMALSGKVNAAAVARFLDHPFFLRMPPKSLDRNDFQELLQDITAPLEEADAVATLSACAAAAVARGFEHFPEPPVALHVSGGGRHNAALMEQLGALVPCAVAPIEELGLDGDMLEAQAFAYLAVRVARGLPTSGPSTTGVAALVGGGRVSMPQEG